MGTDASTLAIRRSVQKSSAYDARAAWQPSYWCTQADSESPHSEIPEELAITARCSASEYTQAHEFLLKLELGANRLDT